jgi:hypothetical protein
MRRLVRAGERSAAAEDERERAGIDGCHGADRAHDMHIFFDQANARQPEIGLDLTELSLCVIAQGAAPHPDSAAGERSGPSRAQQD